MSEVPGWNLGPLKVMDYGDPMTQRIHTLKTRPAYFDAVESGEKTFEIRRNDRAFQRGDIIELVRMNNDLDSTAYAGGRPTIRKRVTYVFTGDYALGPQLGGVCPGYAVLGLGDA